MVIPTHFGAFRHTPSRIITQYNKINLLIYHYSHFIEK